MVESAIKKRGRRDGGLFPGDLGGIRRELGEIEDLGLERRSMGYVRRLMIFLE